MADQSNQPPHGVRWLRTISRSRTCIYDSSWLTILAVVNG
jgi:hypothetical protein